MDLGVFLPATKKVIEAKPSIASTPTHRSDRYARCAHNDVADIEYEYKHRRRRDLQINSWLCRREHPSAMDDGTGGWAKLLVRCLQLNIAEDVEITRTIVPTLLEALERGKPTTWRLVRQLPTSYSR